MTPRFKLGDKVWLIYNYKIREAKVFGVHHSQKIFPGSRCCVETVYYNLHASPEFKRIAFSEELLHPSKEELLESLEWNDTTSKNATSHIKK